MENLSAWLGSETGIAGAVTVLALFAVWVPFQRGVAVFLQARAATRALAPDAIRACLRGSRPHRVEPLCVLQARVFEHALRENAAQHPTDFLRDASRQYVLNEYDSTYGQTLSMYANLLPPIGFIGTLIGLLVLFVSMHLSNESLKLGALAIALTSTIFALIGLAILEALKINLHRRLLGCLAATAAPDEPRPPAAAVREPSTA